MKAKVLFTLNQAIEIDFLEAHSIRWTPRSLDNSLTVHGYDAGESMIWAIYYKDAQKIQLIIKEG